MVWTSWRKRARDCCPLLFLGVPLKCLKEDHAFLLKGDVFTEDVIEKWIEYKMNAEVNPVRMRPVPLEFALYFDC